MPQAVKHDLERRAQGLVVILPEVQGASLDTLPAFLWKTFPTLEARVSAGGNVPVVRGRGIPYTAFVGVDGVLRWAGSPSSGAKELDALIEAELKKVAQGWGVSAEAKKARAQLYGKRNLAEAKKLIDALQDGDERTALQKELATAFSWRAKAVTHLRDEGRVVEAKDAALALKKSVAGIAEWESQAAPLAAGFDGADEQKELALAKKLEGQLAGIRDKKVKIGDAVKPMRALAKSAAGTKTAERAEKLATAFENGMKGR